MNLSEWNLEESLAHFRSEMATAASATEWQALHQTYLSKKSGLVGVLLRQLRDVPPAQKSQMGRDINIFKKEVEKSLKAGAPAAKPKAHKKLDLSLPGVQPPAGGLHPLTLTMNKMVDFFLKMGYDVASGPEIETAYYNFEALNTPENHPARDAADTYYIDDDRMLRTQTSGMQIRYMEQHQPPIRMLSPGKVFRRDDDVTHSPMFHQLEGLAVGPGISFSDLKGTLEAFARHMFGAQTKIRLRPSFFPFTEPSAEVDVSCYFCKSGCRVCKHSGWIEILGCGMVDPAVFSYVGYDPEKVSGFAFGMGIERVAMLHYGVPDIRYFYQNDLRFLQQFQTR